MKICENGVVSLPDTGFSIINKCIALGWTSSRHQVDTFTFVPRSNELAIHVACLQIEVEDPYQQDRNLFMQSALCGGLSR